MKKLALVINLKDNVATALKDLRKSSTVALNKDEKEVKVKLCDDIPLGHKFALEDIRKGKKIIKYGESIGTATKEIKKGEIVHIHNVESDRGRGDLK
jgi:altronate dehydratase small subunit